MPTSKTTLPTWNFHFLTCILLFSFLLQTSKASKTRIQHPQPKQLKKIIRTKNNSQISYCGIQNKIHIKERILQYSGDFGGSSGSNEVFTGPYSSRLNYSNDTGNNDFSGNSGMNNSNGADFGSNNFSGNQNFGGSSDSYNGSSNNFGGSSDSYNGSSNNSYGGNSGSDNAYGGSSSSNNNSYDSGSNSYNGGFTSTSLPCIERLSF